MVSKTFMVSMGMIKRSTLYAGLIGAAGLGLAAGLLWLNFSSPAAQGHSAYSKDRFRFQVPGLSLESDDAASIVPGEGQSAQVLYVAPNGDCGVGVDPCFGSVQAAVDAAEAAAAGGPADEIRVAGGVYTDVHQRAGITQVVYLSKTVTIRGGYIAGSLDGSAWTTSYPLTQPTTLDAGGQGRGLYVTGTISATIEGLRITGGYAHQSGDNVQNGGGIAIAGAAVVLKHNRITGNSARFGGGVHLRLGSTATLRENTISLNVADHGGGLAVQDSSLARLENNAITSNIGHQDGGGVYLSGSDAVLDDNTFTSNATTGYGGGIYIYASQARLSRNTLTSNRAARIGDSLAYGGGLAVFNYSDAVLDDNRIASNSADDNGGGIFILQGRAALERTTIFSNTASGIYVYQGSATLTNTIMAGNTGGGIYLKNSTAQLLHNTIADNGGSGVHVSDLGGWGYSTASLTNTILAGHGVGIAVTGGNAATLEATLWHANGLDWDGAGSIIAGSLNTWGDPAFANPAGGDYHIRPGSFAIDRGVDAGVRADIDGQPRPLGLGYELGADELAFTADYAIYLPCIVKDQ